MSLRRGPEAEAGPNEPAQAGSRTGTLYQNLVFGLCVVFGLALILNIQPAYDGHWFWYAVEFRAGRKLYSDMHLALQPLYMLETALQMAVLGKGWLVSKVPAVVHLLLYCLGLRLLLRQSRLGDFERAAVLGGAFFLTISFGAYRFDDYHVLSDCFELAVLLLLLRLPGVGTRRQLLGVAAGLGVLCGLGTMTRLNDGAALTLGCGIALLALMPAWARMSQRAGAVLVAGGAFALTLVAVVLSTGDTLGAWARNSVLAATGSKGGAGKILMAPVRLPWNAQTILHNHIYLELVGYALMVTAAWVFLVPRRGERVVGWKLGLAAALVLLPLVKLHLWIFNPGLILSYSAIGDIVLYGFGILIVFRLVRAWVTGPERANDGRGHWDAREVLLLIPLGELMSGAMSSAGGHIGVYTPMAVMMVLLPIAAPWWVGGRTVRVFGRTALVVASLLLMLNAGRYKIRYPFIWHNYNPHMMFTDRVWYRHPVYGEMYIERDLLAFVQPVCAQVGGSAPGETRELLSLPFPYANYFCAVPPWHGYVQTFFDTSTKANIDGLTAALASESPTSPPPEWILYQRQLENLQFHEQVFNGGQPLPQRATDALIAQRVASGQWRVTLDSAYGDRPLHDNRWYLIRTR